MTESQGFDDVRRTEGDNPAPSGSRYYDGVSIGFATFIFGPMAGCWFLSRNWKALGDEGAAFRTVITGVAGTMAMFVGVLFLPDNFPHVIVPAAYTAVIEGYFRTNQKARVEALKATDIQKVSGVRVFFVGLLWLALTLIMFLAIVMAINAAFPGFLPDPEPKHHK